MNTSPAGYDGGMTSSTPEPTIHRTFRDSSIDGNVCDVDPWLTTDRFGAEVLVFSFYVNGGFITAEGLKIRKDGTPGVRSLTLYLEAVPANVRAALAGVPA